MTRHTDNVGVIRRQHLRRQLKQSDVQPAETQILSSLKANEPSSDNTRRLDRM